MDIEMYTFLVKIVLTQENAESINRSSKKALFEAFGTLKKKKNRTRNENSIDSTFGNIVFQFKQNFGSNKLNIFHHLSVIGGNFFYNKQEQFCAIQGVDKDVTCIVTPVILQLLGCDTNEASVP